MVAPTRPLQRRIARPLAIAPRITPYATGEFPAELGTNGRPLSLTVKQPLAVRPIVVDANVLRHEVRRALRTQQRTALLDAADGYGLRLFCPVHVVQELDEHLDEWVDGYSPREAREFFERHYLPIIRVVTVPSGPLLPVERARVERLRLIDLDDVPTAILSLMLDAPVLTHDKPLLRAVHGDDADIEALAEWLHIALAGRIMGETDQHVIAAAGLTNLTIYGSFASGAALVRLVRRLPLTLQLLIVGTSLAGIYVARKRIAVAAQSAKGGLMALADQILPVISELVAQREIASEMLLAAGPPSGRDTWATGFPDLPKATAPEALTRLCLYALARSNARSAASLSGELGGEVGVATGEAKVRAVLRSNRCFYQLPRGRFQVGRPWGPRLHLA
jgi:predicted nucleic acid-binding protein